MEFLAIKIRSKSRKKMSKYNKPKKLAVIHFHEKKIGNSQRFDFKNCEIISSKNSAKSKYYPNYF